MSRSFHLLLLVSFISSLSLQAATVPDRKGAVLGDREKLLDDPRWIYNDYEEGFAKARETGKPVLIVLRCIPCLACAGLDAKVLLEDETLSPLLDQFVCVRVINANDLDLSRFQFDFDLSFSTMIFNGDGTVYGRYGSWTHQKNPREETTLGFRRALERALEIHGNYPANRQALAGKQGDDPIFETPVEMPSLAEKYSRNLDWEGEVVQSCVHCHQIGDALRVYHRERKEEMPSELIYPFPSPETVGLELAEDSVARIKSIAPGSAAAQSNLKPGDELVSLNGQPLISHADVSWVLHHAPDSGSLKAEFKRNGTGHDTAIPLPEGWRTKYDISRRVGTWTMRAMALGGLKLEDLEQEQRSEKGLDANALALHIEHAGQYGIHAAAHKAGFKKGDIIVAVDGIESRHTESQLIGHLLKQHQAGEAVSATILRDGERIDLELPIQ